MIRLVTLLLLLCLLTAVVTGRSKPAKSDAKKKKLDRSDGRRWKRLGEVVRAQITSQTQKFMRSRGQSFFIPVYVDILLVGFEADGAFHYQMDADHLLEALVQSHEDICPTIWETGQPSAVCFSVNYETLYAPENALASFETIMHNELMMHEPVGHEVPRDGLSQTMVPVYDVEASGAVEQELSRILNEAYLEGGIPLSGDAKTMAQNRVAIILLNPSKLRMTPLMSLDDGIAMYNLHTDFMSEWARGEASELDLVAQEGGYIYRYTYSRRGGASSWVSSQNFVVVDLSAGPSEFGPLASPSGHVTPSGIPRILPMLTRMARDINAHNEVSTMKLHMLEEAQNGQHAIQRGELAEMLSSATHYIFCPDIKMGRIEHAAQVLVPIIAIHDDETFNAVSGSSQLENGFQYALDLVAVQHGMDMMVDSKQFAVQDIQSVMLHHHRQVAAAIHKARVTRSSSVISNEPGVGIMRSQHVHLDSDVLLRELLMASPMLSDGALEVIDPEIMEEMIERDLESHVRHRGTRVLPVFVISLSSSPDQLLLDHAQLVASNRDAVVVMQMKPPDRGTQKMSELPEDEYGYVFTRHMLNGKHVKLHAAAGVTSNVLAGLAMSLAGVVPPYERYSPQEQAIVQDWRWSHGALPWGPYANSTILSAIFGATARRNIFVSHLESAMHVLQNKLDEVDAFVHDNLQRPFAFLEEEDRTHHGKRPARHWLDALANRSHGYNETLTSDVVQRLESNLQDIEIKLEQIAWSIYAHDFDEAENALPALFAAVDLFSRHVTKDLELAEDVMACCTLHHSSAAIDNLLIALTVMVLCCSILLLTLIYIFFTGRKGRRARLQLPKGFGAPPARGSPSGGSRWSPLARVSPTPSPLNSARSWHNAPSSSYNPSPRNLGV